MFRPSWSGSIRLSLVTVPVKAFTAIEAEKERISLNQLHEKCHNRIRYKKTCPEHGEVPNDEIVMGYEYGPDQYAIIDPDEINQLRSERDRAVNIDKFLPPAEIDPVYYSGQTYYLLPDGKQAEKPYAVLRAAMAKDKVVGLAQVVISNREQLVVVRPIERLLAVSVLHYDAAIRPASAFDDKLGDAEVSSQELKLAKTLIDVTVAKHADLVDYRNLYNERMEALVQAKIAGRNVAKSKADDRGPPVVNFMDALKASLAQKKPRSPGSKNLGTRAKPKTPPKRKKSG